MASRPRSIESESSTSRIEAAKAGRDWAWESIYSELAGPVGGYLRSRGASDADDLASEVFLQVARDIHRFTGDDEKFRSWVFVIAHRRLIDHRRAVARRPDEVAPIERVSDREGGNVEEEVMEELAMARMHDFFNTLTEDQKNVLSLRIVADLTLEETATVLGKRVGAVKALQRRALNRIKTAIEQGRVSL